MNTRTLSRRLGLLLMAALLLVGLVGCGGGGHSTGTGGARLQIVWPTRTRLIPVASNSIKVSFLNGASVVASQVVVRPTTGNTSTVTFSDLPAGSLTLKAEAFPTNNGTGVAQASASRAVTITAGVTANLSITMNSTINSLLISPSAPSIAVGATVTLTATAVNSALATVLIDPANVTWETSDGNVATVSNTGVVTGVNVGTARITAHESESAKSSFVDVTVTSGGSGGTAVDLATTYLNSLTATQQAATVVTNNATNVAKWSNLAATPDGSGTNILRNGVSYSSLTADQKVAWANLVQAALGANGYARLGLVRRAEDYLGTLNSAYSGDFVYVGFVGTPSASGNWVLQIGGHNFAANLYYSGNTLVSTTPYYLAVEPDIFTIGGTSYNPLQPQRDAIFNLISSLDTTQLASAQLGTTFTDVLLGPGKDARSNFPTGTTGRGILASSLTSAQKSLLKAAIAAWTQDSRLGSTYQSLYESELDQTYVGYSGSTGLTGQGDYVRIDGPHVWIEFLVKNSTTATGQQFQTVWRDRVSDYNAAYGF